VFQAKQTTAFRAALDLEEAASKAAALTAALQQQSQLVESKRQAARATHQAVADTGFVFCPAYDGLQREDLLAAPLVPPPGLGYGIQRSSSSGRGLGGRYGPGPGYLATGVRDPYRPSAPFQPWDGYPWTSQPSPEEIGQNYGEDVTHQVMLHRLVFRLSAKQRRRTWRLGNHHPTTASHVARERVLHGAMRAMQIWRMCLVPPQGKDLTGPPTTRTFRTPRWKTIVSLLCSRGSQVNLALLWRRMHPKGHQDLTHP
jgi:hypothetical protein